MDYNLLPFFLLAFVLIRIYLKGIIVEGNYRGLLELNPVPFNVVLEDDTYKGQIKIGLKYIPNVRSCVLYCIV